jgi:hypothetical protein
MTCGREIWAEIVEIAPSMAAEVVVNVHASPQGGVDVKRHPKRYSGWASTNPAWKLQRRRVIHVSAPTHTGPNKVWQQWDCEFSIAAFEASGVDSVLIWLPTKGLDTRLRRSSFYTWYGRAATSAGTTLTSG